MLVLNDSAISYSPLSAVWDSVPSYLMSLPVASVRQKDARTSVLIRVPVARPAELRRDQRFPSFRFVSDLHVC